MRSLTTLCLVFTLLVPALAQDKKRQPLMKARAGHKTVLTKKTRDDNAWPAVPDARFEVVEYSGPLGAMKGMLAKPDKPAKKNPAILWLTGGFPAGGAGSSIWESPDPTNDQSAQAFRHAGMMVFYPGLRGSFGNPGHQEAFYGEVDDVIAATLAFRKLPSVDEKRVYLAGHSSGALLALLVAAARSDLYAGVYAFGPVGDIGEYGPPWAELPVCERELRSPMWFLPSIQTPTLIAEGLYGNSDSVSVLEIQYDGDPFPTVTPTIRFEVIDDRDHFDHLADSVDELVRRVKAGERP